jgi:ribulose-phosphate 3-epimerase
MFEIIPGILEKEWGEIEKKIEIVKPFVKTIHIDILDGKFAENTTFLDPTPFKKYSSDILFELHMMVEEPINYIKPWAEAGFKRFIGHIEKMSDQAAFITMAEEYGYAGLAVDGKTSLDKLTVSHLDIDIVLIMTIDAGFSGQEFQKEQLEKVKKLTKDTEMFPVEVDGGVNEEKLVEAWKAGARRFVTTSTLFGSDDPAKMFTTLHEKCVKLAESVPQ